MFYDRLNDLLWMLGYEWSFRNVGDNEIKKSQITVLACKHKVEEKNLIIIQIWFFEGEESKGRGIFFFQNFFQNIPVHILDWIEVEIVMVGDHVVDEKLILSIDGFMQKVADWVLSKFDIFLEELIKFYELSELFDISFLQEEANSLEWLTLVSWFWRMHQVGYPVKNQKLQMTFS